MKRADSVPKTTVFDTLRLMRSYLSGEPPHAFHVVIPPPPATRARRRSHLIVSYYVPTVYRDAVPPAQVGRQLCRGAVHLRSEPLGVVHEAFVLDAYRDAVDRPVASMPAMLMSLTHWAILPS